MTQQSVAINHEKKLNMLLSLTQQIMGREFLQCTNKEVGQTKG